MVEPGGTNPSLVFALTDLSILARCTIVYVTILEGETEWSMDDRQGDRGGRKKDPYGGAGLTEDKLARLNYC